jgi:hypothetical protein
MSKEDSEMSCCTIWQTATHLWRIYWLFPIPLSTFPWSPKIFHR